MALVFLLSPIQNPWYLCWVVPFLCFFPSRSWILLTGLVGLYYIDFYFDYQEIQSWTKWTPWFEYLPFYLLLIWDLCNKNNMKTCSVVNVVESSIARHSDCVLPIHAGPEIGVAATKSFTSQLAILYKITNQLSTTPINLDWKKISESISVLTSENSKIQELAKVLKDVSDIYILGRGIHFPIAKEAALKLKELTYIHAEGIPGGELKHGPLALMDSNVFVIIINPNDSTYQETLNSANEIKARGAKIIGISNKNDSVYDLSLIHI